MTASAHLAILFDTSKQNIGQHISNILEEKELDINSVVKNYFTTVANGKDDKIAFRATQIEFLNDSREYKLGFKATTD